MPKFSDNALGRLKSGVMNKTEAEYAQQLELLKHAGKIKGYWFERMTLKIAEDTRYNPDFMVMNANNEIEFHEVKGFWRDDAKVKIKVASDQFPFRFFVARKERGNFTIEEVK